MAVGGRVLKEEDEDRDLWVNKHPCPNSCPRDSAHPFPGGHETRVLEEGILVWRLAWLGCFSAVGIIEPALGPQGSGKSLNFQHSSLQQEKENSSDITFLSPTSLSLQNDLAR